jgi:hypothetical protein
LQSLRPHIPEPPQSRSLSPQHILSGASFAPEWKSLPSLATRNFLILSGLMMTQSLVIYPMFSIA